MNGRQAFCLTQPGSKCVDPHPEVGRWYPGQPGNDPVGEDKIYPPPSDRVPKPENDRNASVPHVRKNHIYEFVPDKQSGFPVDRVSKVYPVVSFPDNAINQASQTAVREHQAQFVTTSRILQQRQTIELIPVTRVHYTWKEKTYIYFVYGAEHKVYTDDYPAKCCCCTII
ncbi:Protein SSUH2-like [Acipenser ruthenus]|uniref:Protein SSUH2-like n=1 Tax=Acipenser ruthenus TaxID=7906 RepID=A0A444UZM5_ACIRT|nr:Protein SSUH2-like [Acipenser ruthenus]